MMQSELDRNAAMTHDQRIQMAKQGFWDQRHPTMTLNTPNGPIVMINGKQVRMPAQIAQNAPQEDLGNGITRVHSGKESYIHDPELSPTPIPEKQYQQVRRQHLADQAKANVQHPEAGIVASTTPGVYVAHDGKGGQKLMSHNGTDFVPLGKETKPKPEPVVNPHIVHTTVKKDNGTIEHHLVNTQDGTFTIAKPGIVDNAAKPKIKTITEIK